MELITKALQKYRISRLRELAERTRHAEAILRRIDADSGLFECDASRFYKRSAIGGLELDLNGIKNQAQRKLDELIHECREMEFEHVTLKEYVTWFDTKAEAARRLGWTPQHLQDRLKAKKPIWVCERTKKWFIEGGKYE